MIRAMILEPGKLAEVKFIDKSCKDLRALVGGEIEFTWPVDNNTCVIINEEGKIAGLPLNRALRDKDGKILDIYAGTMVVVGMHGDDFDDLTDEEVTAYLATFGEPESVWDWINDVSKGDNKYFQ